MRKCGLRRVFLTPWQGRGTWFIHQELCITHIVKVTCLMGDRFSRHQARAEMCCYFTMHHLCVYLCCFCSPAYGANVTHWSYSVRQSKLWFACSNKEQVSSLSSWAHHFCEYLSWIYRLCYSRWNQMLRGAGDKQKQRAGDKGSYCPASVPLLCWQQLISEMTEKKLFVDGLRVIRSDAYILN